MKCGFCALEFDPSESDFACKSCPLVKGCHLVRCPRCGYEMPPEAKAVAWFRQLSQRVKQRKQEAVYENESS
ncbi:MAG: hypothetical protein WAM60_15275 [Candidatus Promineifilaceae bacterium]